jgi:hypothetical protein
MRPKATNSNRRHIRGSELVLVCTGAGTRLHIHAAAAAADIHLPFFTGMENSKAFKRGKLLSVS